MLLTLKPQLRAIKYGWLRYFSEWQASQSKASRLTTNQRITFLIGCGRSGTTILGEILSLHPQISYLFEPYHLWAGVDNRTDVLNLYHQLEASLLMDASMVTPDAHRRFERLIGSRGKKSQLLLEKTPLNAMRIGYLQALAPHSKFIHLVRDGVDVCRSIAKLAIGNTYKIAGKPLLNQWWGIKNAKWFSLVRDGITAQYYADEVPYLKEHEAKGAYEWLVSLEEVERWRTPLNNSLFELTYSSLTLEPISNLKNLCEFLGLDSPLSWLKQAKSMIKTSQVEQQYILTLPSSMCQAFNNYQKYYGFSQRAITQQ